MELKIIKQKIFEYFLQKYQSDYNPVVAATYATQDIFNQYRHHNEKYKIECLKMECEDFGIILTA
jgi:hypothetical protein